MYKLFLDFGRMSSATLVSDTNVVGVINFSQEENVSGLIGIDLKTLEIFLSSYMIGLQNVEILVNSVVVGTNNLCLFYDTENKLSGNLFDRIVVTDRYNTFLDKFVKPHKQDELKYFTDDIYYNGTLLNITKIPFRTTLDKFYLSTPTSSYVYLNTYGMLTETSGYPVIEIRNTSGKIVPSLPSLSKVNNLTFFKTLGVLLHGTSTPYLTLDPTKNEYYYQTLPDGVEQLVSNVYKEIYLQLEANNLPLETPIYVVNAFNNRFSSDILISEMMAMVYLGQNKDTYTRFVKNDPIDVNSLLTISNSVLSDVLLAGENVCVINTNNITVNRFGTKESVIFTNLNKDDTFLFSHFRVTTGKFVQPNLTTINNNLGILTSYPSYDAAFLLNDSYKNNLDLFNKTKRFIKYYLVDGVLREPAPINYTVQYGSISTVTDILYPNEDHSPIILRARFNNLSKLSLIDDFTLNNKALIETELQTKYTTLTANVENYIKKVLTRTGKSSIFTNKVKLSNFTNDDKIDIIAPLKSTTLRFYKTPESYKYTFFTHNTRVKETELKIRSGKYVTPIKNKKFYKDLFTETETFTINPGDILILPRYYIYTLDGNDDICFMGTYNTLSKVI